MRYITIFSFVFFNVFINISNVKAQKQLDKKLVGDWSSCVKRCDPFNMEPYISFSDSSVSLFLLDFKTVFSEGNKIIYYKERDKNNN
ncbi:MAG: hypothetical protein WBG43_05090 [Marinifilaceae bacterium]